MLLSKKYKVTLYEANDYLGGHALTLNEKLLVNDELTNISFDVGFLVYNKQNYPLFSKMIKLLITLGFSRNILGRVIKCTIKI